MTKETRATIIAVAVRWASNMIVEAVSNHHSILDEKCHEALKQAIKALNEADLELNRFMFRRKES